MRKTFIYLIFIIVLLTSCSTPMNMNNVVKEPNFAGLVEEVHEGIILLRVNEENITSSDLVSVSLDVKLKDSITEFQVGDQVRVYYDGSILESYPAQVNNVYAIVLIDLEK